ncbi:MAG TPA: cysteine--tRNA ligase [Candidatus Saccharimonadia bacterium]|nr:cysteine--tRNA ligase [Candidatus Saccharimonadia bacterium]
MKMDLVLYNTRTRRLEPFAPQDPDRVTMYVCGPTVYNYAHIGNARPYVLFGLLARLLRARYPNVVYARNITDVDDKINDAARAVGVPIDAITDRYTAAFHDDMLALGADLPDVEPRATRTIGPIIAMIEKLIASGHAYLADGHVLFSVASYADYGHLSGRTTDEQIDGARVDVESYKRDAGDFVLWKPSTPDLPGWDSPWGRGRPGWHIECSAMSEVHLGETIDIHAGGNDLLFPHHENEVAQSTCAHGGKLFARVWMHNGFVTMEGRKMSKSLGNVRLISELRQSAPPEAMRYLLMNAHYRQPLDWSVAALAQAVRTLDRLYDTLRDLADVPSAPPVVPAGVEAALCDDLNTPKALAELAHLAGEARKATTDDERRTAKAALLGAGTLLGLLGQSPAAWFAQSSGGVEVDEALVESLLARRQEAKLARDFAAADAFRAELAALGVQIEDTSQGTRWRVAKPVEAAPN